MFAGSCLFWVEEMLNDYTNVIALFSLFAKSDKQKSLQFSSLQMYHLYHMYHVFSLFFICLAWSHGICGADRQHLITPQELGNGLVHKASQHMQSFNGWVVKGL